MEVIAKQDLLKLSAAWHKLQEDKDVIHQLETEVLEPYLRTCRWFYGKGLQLNKLEIEYCLPFETGNTTAHLLVFRADYTTEEVEHYLLPISFIPGDAIVQVPAKALIAEIQVEEQHGWMVDAIYDTAFQDALFKNFLINKKLKQEEGYLQFSRGKGLTESNDQEILSCSVPNVDQSNTSLIYGEKYFLKFYRKLYREINPEVEMIEFLTEKGNFNHIPAFAGSIMYHRPESAPVTFALMMEKIASQKDSWSDTGDSLNDFLYAMLEQVFAVKEDVFEKIELLGQRTAEMHLALCGEKKLETFKPEKYTTEYKEWLQRHLNKLLRKRYQLLSAHLDRVDEQARGLAKSFLNCQKLIKEFFDKISTRHLESSRIRIHGDYHLGQILWTGEDYIIIDFEGEPESSIKDRKIKHSPLKDVAGMIRSFHYAVCAKLYFSEETRNLNVEQLQKSADRWYKLITDTYLDAYMRTIDAADAKLFRNKGEINFLLQLHLLEKAVYELGYELNGRPDWIKIPLKGIQHVLKEIEKLKE